MLALSFCDSLQLITIVKMDGVYTGPTASRTAHMILYHLGLICVKRSVESGTTAVWGSMAAHDHSKSVLVLATSHQALAHSYKLQHPQRSRFLAAFQEYPSRMLQPPDIESQVYAILLEHSIGNG